MSRNYRQHIEIRETTRDYRKLVEIKETVNGKRKQVDIKDNRLRLEETGRN